MNSTSFSLNYDELAKSYVDALHTNLRNFRIGPDFLETWVPDEDHHKSIFGLFESGEMGSLKNLSVLVSSKVSSSLDRVKLEKDLATFGKAVLNERQDGLTVIV